MRWGLPLLLAAGAAVGVGPAFLGQRYGRTPFGGAAAETHGCHSLFDLNRTSHPVLQRVDDLLQAHLGPLDTDPGGIHIESRMLQAVLGCWYQGLQYTADGVTPTLFPVSGEGEEGPLVLGEQLHLRLLLRWAPSRAAVTGLEHARYTATQLRVHDVAVFFDEEQSAALTRHTWFPVASVSSRHAPLTSRVYHPPLAPTLKVMTYNMWNYNPPWPLRCDMICSEVRKQRPHVIAWQELRYDNAPGPHPFPTHHQVQHLLAECDGAAYQFVFQPAMTYLQHHHSGLQFQLEGPAIFSRHPILLADYLLLSRNPADPGDDHQRVCLGAAVLVPGWGRVVNVFSTHLTLSARQQLQSAYEIHRWARDFANRSAALTADHHREPLIVIMGDLNMEPDAPAMQFFRGELRYKGVTAGYRDLFDSTSPVTFNAMGDARKRIDFILVSGLMEAKRTRVVGKARRPVHPGAAKTTASSDHWPVVSTLCHPHC
eukprot:EG_transcript_9633